MSAHASDTPLIGEMLFVLTDGKGKADPKKRSLIRKYAMLGKNQGKTRNVKPVKMESPCGSEGSNRHHDEAPGLLIKMHYPRMPRQTISELSFTQFAADVEAPVIHDLLKCRSTPRPRHYSHSVLVR